MNAPLVLIVEDHAVNRKLLRDILQARGYRTIESGCAEDGLALALEHHPDLILLDIQLPGMDGIRALGALRADHRTTSIPVIAVTASTMTQSRERMLAAGFDGYQAKPINVRQFLEAVRASLPAGEDGAHA